jgi:hypothetical protein
MDNSAGKLGEAILELPDDEKRCQTLAATGHARLTQELNRGRSWSSWRPPTRRPRNDDSVGELFRMDVSRG